MTRWLLAAVIALVGAWVAYGPLWRGTANREGSALRDIARPVTRGWAALALGGLRAGAYLCLLAMLLGAPAGAPTPLAPLPVLDVSESWLRGDAGAAWQMAKDSIGVLAGDTVLLTGDSSRIALRADAMGATPSDQRSALQPALDQATALGRAVVVITDGELEDGASLRRLPAGSRVIAVERPARADLAVADLELPVYATGGDTIDVGVTITAGNATLSGGTLSVALDELELARVTLQPLEPFASRRVSLRAPLPRGAGVRRLTAVVDAPNDVESRNDTLAAALDITDRPRVVFVSTVPDLDVREVLRVLRGTVMLPARAYLRIAPGIWREEGTLAPVSETLVRQRANEAGLLVLHGDTAWSGIAAERRGASLLWAPAPAPAAARAGEFSRPVEWFPFRAPPSPISTVLEGLPFDSLAPLDIGTAVEGGTPLLEARAGRSGTSRVVASVTSASGARQIRIAGSGFAEWALRGGRSSDAFTALWGAIFDWLAVSEGDGNGVWLSGGLIRAGEPLRWRRGGGDSLQTVVLSREGGTSDSLAIRFENDADVVETSALSAGRYTVRVGERTQAVVVNPSREWVPRAPVAVPPIPSAGAPSRAARPLLERLWPFLLALILLSVEWFGRRAVGLR